MLEYTKDKNGEDILIDHTNKLGDVQVMMEWEKPYMEACIDKLKPKGDVLEIGFGIGYSATQIQKYKPKSYTIIECDPVVIKKCKKWAEDYDNVTIIESTWQEAFKNKSYGIYDEVFFDDHPIEYNNNQKQGSLRIKLFVQMLMEYNLIKEGARMSFYTSCDPSDNNINHLQNLYENIRVFNKKGRWKWAHESFNVKISNVANYHTGKGRALIPLITYSQNG